jgi:acetyl-CoA carboxylase biotin carboxyl carrier protein
MDLRKLKTLIDLVAESSITELEVTEGEEKVKIVKGGYAHQGYAQANGQTYMVGGMPPVSGVSSGIVPFDLDGGVPGFSNASNMHATAPAAPVAAPAPAKPAEGKVIKSPMVGTFYAASGPDKPDFVTVGAVVKANQTVCIIEAMKLLNEIEAGIDGTIVELLVKNGTPVEFGQPLFIVA